MPTGNTGTTKLPVLVWGNGGCSGDGTSNSKLLLNIASYGYLAIASGEPSGKTSTTAALMTASIDWAVKNAGQGAYANVDATKIMAAGFSCGGVEANAQIWDDRVKTVGIVSSGLLQNTTAAKDFHKPIVYIIGGSGDVAYNNVSSSQPSPRASSGLGLGRSYGTGAVQGADTQDRPSATTRLFPRTRQSGRATSPSATVVLSSTPTAAPSARRF